MMDGTVKRFRPGYALFALSALIGLGAVSGCGARPVTSSSSPRASSSASTDPSVMNLEVYKAMARYNTGTLEADHAAARVHGAFSLSADTFGHTELSNKVEIRLAIDAASGHIDCISQVNALGEGVLFVRDGKPVAGRPWLQGAITMLPHLPADPLIRDHSDAWALCQSEVSEVSPNHAAMVTQVDEEVVPDGTLDNEPLTRYRFTAHFEHTAAQFTASPQALGGKERDTMLVWVDSRNLPRRFKMYGHLPSSSFEVSYSGWQGPVDVAAPDPSQVTVLHG